MVRKVKLGMVVASLMVVAAGALPAWADTTQEISIIRVEEDGRLLIQMRPIFEALTWDVTWKDLDQQILATRADQNLTLVMWINRREAISNGTRVKLDVPPRLLLGSTYVPLRFVAETTGDTVDYQGNQVVIKDGAGGTLIVHLLEPV